MTDPGTPIARLGPVVLRAALWALLLAVVATTKTDPDLWGHVRFGIDIIESGTARLAEMYSFTSDREWVNHEWAAEAVFGAVYLAAGSAGLIAVKVLVILGVLLLLNRLLRLEGVNAPRHRDLLAAAAVIATIEQAHHVRPQIFSLLFFAALLSVLQLARRDARWLMALPALFALWTNFHGGWIVGGGILILWTAGLAFSRPPDARAVAWHLAAGAASLAATLVNPHGIGLLTFLRDTVGFGRADITDWQPVYALEPQIAILWVLTAALAATGLYTARQRGLLTPERLLVVAALGIGSFRVNRLIAFFALATLFLLGRAVALRLPGFEGAAAAPARRGTSAAAVAVAVLILAGASRLLSTAAGCIQVDPRTTPAPGAVEFLKNAGREGRLVVWFNWGQYALWHLAPDFRVSMDGRRETVYSASMQDRHLRFYFDAPGGAALPGELKADYVWLPEDLPGASRLTEEGWPTLYAGDGSVVFGHPTRHPQSRAAAVAVSRTDDAISGLGATADRRCFPGP